MSDTHQHDVQSHIKTYIKVFLALAVGTVVTVLASKVHQAIVIGIIIALIIATVKGSLVAAFFMHLSSERKMIYWILALTASFIVIMIGLFMFSKGDQQGRQSGIFEVPQQHVPLHPTEGAHAE